MKMVGSRMTRRVLASIVVMVALTVVASDGASEEGESLWQRLDVGVHGFADVRAGTRTGSDPTQRDVSLLESRLQLELNRMGDWATVLLRGDFIYDDVAGDRDFDLETGSGWFDLREANLLFSPVSFADVKAGRQILTWGTGDLLFINDLFPKDWKSFFVGRDVEYLKAPSDALFVSLFPPWMNIDIAYTPRFDSDRYISGERVSYWNPLLGRRAGRDAVMAVDRPDQVFDDDELAVRVSRNVGGYELAAYGYTGRWKSPVGMDMVTTNAIFPALNVYGASVRGSLAEGVACAEFGYYDSRDDQDGTSPFLPNSEMRLLLGYEREIAANLTAGLQYYVEHMTDYDAYRATLPPGMRPRDEDRHVTTVRVTKQAMNQNLILSMFAYYSPSDADAYLRPNVTYKVSDNWKVNAGGNVFIGADDHTFFGQFEKNNNVYAGARYSF